MSTTPLFLFFQGGFDCVLPGQYSQFPRVAPVLPLSQYNSNNWSIFCQTYLVPIVTPIILLNVGRDQIWRLSMQVMREYIL